MQYFGLKGQKELQANLPSYIKIKNSKRARRMALRLDPKDRCFYLVMPRGSSLTHAMRFLGDKESWVKKRLAELPRPIAFQDGQSIPVCGKLYTIRTSIDADAAHKVCFNGKVLQVSSIHPDQVEGRVKRFLKNHARTVLSDLAHEKAARINKTIQSIQIRDTKSRWGSCSETGRISLSWRLILAPFEAMDYVVAHEIAHLVHMNHSRAFWDLCRDLAYDAFEGEYWMKNHSMELMRYG